MYLIMLYHRVCPPDVEVFGKKGTSINIFIGLLSSLNRQLHICRSFRLPCSFPLHMLYLYQNLPKHKTARPFRQFQGYSSRLQASPIYLSGTKRRYHRCKEQLPMTASEPPLQLRGPLRLSPDGLFCKIL